MSVHEILSAITEAKVALDREPQLTSRILELERSLNQSQQHAQAIELKLIDRNDTIDSLQSKVRSLEVERDDMGFRELEAEDKVERLLNAMRYAEQNLGEAADGADPNGSLFELFYSKRKARDVPISQAEPISEALPVASPQAGNSTGQPTETEPVHSLYQEEPVKPLGQSESPLPSALTQVIDMSPTVKTSVTSEGVALGKPYEGKSYSQAKAEGMPYTPYSEWAAKGGSYENYNK